MPFAKKFRAMMEIPFTGEMLDGFTVEESEARDVPGTSGLHAYALRLILRGYGGQQAVRRAVGRLLSARPVTFSGYGNPYQLWCNRPEIESLGDQRYVVTALGAGAPIPLEDVLQRFLHYLSDEGLFSEPETTSVAVVRAYMDRYRDDIARKVGRYRGRLEREERQVAKG